MAMFCENCLGKIQQLVFPAKYFVQVQQEESSHWKHTKARTDVVLSFVCHMGWQFFVQFNTNSQSNLAKYCMIHTQA